jgi:hypothetical protein
VSTTPRHPCIAAISLNSDVLAAAANNAEWCGIFCRTHGIGGAFYPHFWASPTRTPPYYPDAVTLDQAATAQSILGVIDTATPGCSVKDSFANLDMSREGFRILFESEWIWRAPGPPAHASGGVLNWRRVVDTAELEAWEAARSGWSVDTRLFRPALLDHPAVTVLGGYIQEHLVAGAVLNQSRAVVGVSNVFAEAGALGDARAGCVEAVAIANPGLPIVGYESGKGLSAACDCGFSSVGRLRVWINGG